MFKSKPYLNHYRKSNLRNERFWMKEDVNEIVVIFGSSILLFRENGMSLKTTSYEAWTRFNK